MRAFIDGSAVGTAPTMRVAPVSGADGESRTVMEMDFLIVDGGKVRPIEVRSSGTTKHVSLDKFRDKFGRRIGQAVIPCTKDLEERDGILYLPLYMAPLLRRPDQGGRLQMSNSGSKRIQHTTMPVAVLREEPTLAHER